MSLQKNLGILVAGISAGLINGLLGTGGGMVLVPLLTCLTDLDDCDVFPTSVSIILPICLVSLGFTLTEQCIDWMITLPYLLGSTIGGIGAGLLGKKIPTKCLHKGLGILILWGGIQYLC